MVRVNTEVLNEVKELINTDELRTKLKRVVVAGSETTWLDLTGEVLPLVVSAVENGKVELTSAQKSTLASDIILPLIKDKLPWYIKPFASSLVKWLIAVAVSTLNCSQRTGTPKLRPFSARRKPKRTSMQHCPYKEYDHYFWECICRKTGKPCHVRYCGGKNKME